VGFFFDGRSGEAIVLEVKIAREAISLLKPSFGGRFGEAIVLEVKVAGKAIGHADRRTEPEPRGKTSGTSSQDDAASFSQCRSLIKQLPQPSLQ